MVKPGLNFFYIIAKLPKYNICYPNIWKLAKIEKNWQIWQHGKTENSLQQKYDFYQKK